MARISLSVAALMFLGLPHIVEAGWPFFADNGPPKGSREYYEAHAADPPGSRQKYHHGKLWPPRPRPVGEEQPFIHKYHTAHYWPHPYNCEDRATVARFAELQIANGWQAATTLYDYHFDPTTHQLNSAGRTQLHWILTHVPIEHRQAYVAVGAQSQSNAVRVQNVEHEIATIVGTDAALPVLMRVTNPLGRPAAEVQKIFSTAEQNMLPPVISYGVADE